MEQTDLQGMLGALTQNPELMGKLRQIAGGLAASSAQAEKAESAISPEQEISHPLPSNTKRLLGDLGSRKQLLSALRPFLHEKRQKRLDEILNLLCLLEAAENTGLLSQLLSGTAKKEEDHVSS